MVDPISFSKILDERLLSGIKPIETVDCPIYPYDIVPNMQDIGPIIANGARHPNRMARIITIKAVSEVFTLSLGEASQLMDWCLRHF